MRQTPTGSGQTRKRSGTTRGRSAVGLLLAFATLASVVVAGARPSEAQAPVFTVVVLPDTQHYLNRDFPGREHFFADQVDWVIDERAGQNIVFVSHVGDVVQNSQDRTEWAKAEPIFDALEASGLPFGVAPGNHDLLYDATSPAFDEVLPAARFANQPWYGGNFDNNRNSYQVVANGDDDLLFLHLRFLRYGSIDTTLQWAREVLEAHPEHLAFVTTHEFSGADGGVLQTRLRDEVLIPSCNVVAVFSGHIHGQSRGSFSDSCGRSVPYMLSNYQSWDNGGNGYLRLYQVDPATMAITARSYSPTLDWTLTDDRQSFTVQAARPAGAPNPTVPETVLSLDSSWRYYDDGVPAPGWHQPAFDDGQWATGAAELGFGDGDESTLLNTSDDDGRRLSAAYFRTTFAVSNQANIESATVRILADDGAVVWLNGQRVVDDNMPTGPVSYQTLSSSGRWGAAERSIQVYPIPPSILVEGENTLAVEVHQRDPDSSDLSFNAGLEVGRQRDDNQPPRDITAIEFGSAWRFYDRGPAPSEWTLAGFDDGGWATGAAQLGFGDGDEQTTLARTVDGDGLHTAYFRHTVVLAPDDQVETATVELLADDGAVVWVNGQRVVTDNLPGGPIDYFTLSSSGRWGPAEQEVRSFAVPGDVFQSGLNQVAIEVHQRDRWSSDLSFDARLTLRLS